MVDSKKLTLLRAIPRTPPFQVDLCTGHGFDATELLEIIYMDICGPFPTPCMNGCHRKNSAR